MSRLLTVFVHGKGTAVLTTTLHLLLRHDNGPSR